MEPKSFEQRKQMILANYAMKNGYNVEVTFDETAEESPYSLDSLRHVYDRDLAKVLNGFTDTGSELRNKDGFDKVFLKAVRGRDYADVSGFERYDALYKEGDMFYTVEEGKLPKLYVTLPLNKDFTSLRVLGAYDTVGENGPFKDHGLYLKVKGGVWMPLGGE